MTLEAIEQRLQTQLGSTATEDLGVLSRRDFLRYALAAGDDNYVAETEAAPTDQPVEAPVMFLPGILHWTIGPLERELRADGLAARDAPGIKHEDVNVMHGGQRMEFHRRAVEGMRVTAYRTMRAATSKHGKGGDFLVVVTRTEFMDEARAALTTVDDTILILPR